MWDDLNVREAARWCRVEREVWPLDRSLRIWLAYEANVDWNPDDPTEQASYDALFDAVLAIWREG